MALLLNLPALSTVNGATSNVDIFAQFDGIIDGLKVVASTASPNGVEPRCITLPAFLPSCPLKKNSTRVCGRISLLSLRVSAEGAPVHVPAVGISSKRKATSDPDTPPRDNVTESKRTEEEDVKTSKSSRVTTTTTLVVALTKQPLRVWHTPLTHRT